MELTGCQRYRRINRVAVMAIGDGYILYIRHGKSATRYAHLYRAEEWGGQAGAIRQLLDDMYYYVDGNSMSGVDGNEYTARIEEMYQTPQSYYRVYETATRIEEVMKRELAKLEE